MLVQSKNCKFISTIVRGTTIHGAYMDAADVEDSIGEEAERRPDRGGEYEHQRLHLGLVTMVPNCPLLFERIPYS